MFYQNNDGKYYEQANDGIYTVTVLNGISFWLQYYVED